LRYLAGKIPGSRKGSRKRDTDRQPPPHRLIEAHLLDLGGTHGDPYAGDPIQYDEL